MSGRADAGGGRKPDSAFESGRSVRFDFEGHVAAVTGAGRGLGRAIAQALVAAGASVAIADLDVEGAERTASALGSKAFPYLLDVADSLSAEACAARVRADIGTVSLLVNNAGICGTEDFFDLETREWDRSMAVNLSGAFYCMRAFLPAMREAGGGAVVNVGSVAGRGGGTAVSAAYSASKAGIAGLTKAAAKQLAKYAIRVNCVAPGTLETDMTAEWGSDTLRKLRETVALGRLGGVEDVVGAVLFLLSPAARYMTGATVDVNGGLYIAP